ncbi:H-NS histone family protein [Castellaniella sp.]|uniref:H-NS histone family protein n=1 Tax=Castellaniella sp. TaxID=1955812 RepID=UPI002B002986|nr:H-NS histone family protein [Castellaniella sp.]
MATYLELKAKAEELLKEAEQVRQEEIAGVVADIKEKIQEYGITAADLGFSGFGRKVAKSMSKASNVEPKYKGPNGELWSGRGRQPVWMKEAIEQGKDKEDFAI